MKAVDKAENVRIAVHFPQMPTPQSSIISVLFVLFIVSLFVVCAVYLFLLRKKLKKA